MTILYILLAIVVLLVLITVHEFGHYIAGKVFGFKINEFSIGFGPAIYKKMKKDGEVFAVRAFPLGGFCAFEGEDEAGNETPDAFNNRPAWKRIIVLLSGVTFNFLFGILTAVIYLLVTGYATIQTSNTVFQQGVKTAGFERGDIVVAVDGKTVEAYRNFNSLISKYKEDEEFVVKVNRDGQIVDIVAKKQNFPAFYYVANESYFDGKLFVDDGTGNAVALPIEDFIYELTQQSTELETDEDEGKGSALVVYLSTIYKDAELTDSYEDEIELMLKGNAENKIYPSIYYSARGTSLGIVFQYVGQRYTLAESITRAWPFCIYLCGTILSALGGLFVGKTALKDMGGTVTAVSQIAEISQMGIEYFLLLLPLLSMNLALFNILPIPSLDGARAVFVLIELIFRKPVPRKIEGWIHAVGLFALLGLVLFFDIYHFAVASKLLTKLLL